MRSCPRLKMRLQVPNAPQFQVRVQALKSSKPTSSKNTSKMSGLPRRDAGGVCWPPALAPAPAGEDGYYSTSAADKPESLTAKAFKGRTDAFEAYCEAEWNEVPDTERPEPFLAAWYNCVKKYRFIKYGGPLAGGPKLIIEVELMGKTSLRYILRVSQVKGVLTKSSVHDTHGYVRIEEVIIDTRPYIEYAPEQVKLRFAGSDNALAFQLDLMSAL